MESETWKKILACCHYECAPVDPIHICFCRISMARLRPPGRVLINLLSNFLAAALSGKSRILWQDWLLMIRRDQFSIWSAGSWILLHCLSFQMLLYLCLQCIAPIVEMWCVFWNKRHSSRLPPLPFAAATRTIKITNNRQNLGGLGYFLRFLNSNWKR